MDNQIHAQLVEHTLNLER